MEIKSVMRSRGLMSLMLCGLLAGLLPAYAQADKEGGEFARQIEYRQSVMNVFAWNLKPMGAMVQGKAPFDAERFAKYAHELAVASGLDLLSGFPEDSDAGDETDALAEIWLDFEDFAQKFEDLRASARSLDQAAQSSDENSKKAAFDKVAKSCKACHKAYRD